MDTTIPTPDLDSPPSSELPPRRPAGLPCSNTFGEMSPHEIQKAQNTSLQQEETQEEVAPDQQEHLDVTAGTIIAITVSVFVVLVLILIGLHTRSPLQYWISSSSSSSSGSGTSNSNSNNNNIEANTGDREYDVEMQASIGVTEQEQPQPEDHEELWSRQDSQHEEEEQWPPGEHSEEEGEGEGETGPVEMGTARVAQLVTPGAVSIVDIRRSNALSLKSSRSVRDVSSLPDLAWAQSLTTGGGRSGMSVASANSASSVPVCRGLEANNDACSPSPSSSLSKRKGLRKLVRKSKVREWCERGMGSGGFGPYAGMY